ncbi:polymer-forming cytoskeletal protein [Thermospira aquatica]|uniref:Polymer-forming cytoskeletal protein n=1 Tax=Thermospira aquatica TaxID=2828656 RepID=A0AAX3BA34_9SPIR|nr:polymer-forming cytoskeletal protein [Thermospira aquatica]URA09122.1 polymer-forming cytoskeletal protein [Thermospira aquatica]
MAHNIDRYRDYPTVTKLSNTSEWSGTMRFKTSLRIDGNYEGKIDAEGLLVIGPDAKIKGDIICDEVIVGGEIHGNVHARKRLELFNTAKLYGDIKTPKLKMDDGVIFQGKCEMLPTNK